MGHLARTIKALCTEACVVEIYKDQALFPDINTHLVDQGFELVWKGNDDDPALTPYYFNALYVRGQSRAKLALYGLVRAPILAVSKVHTLIYRIVRRVRRHSTSNAF